MRWKSSSVLIFFVVFSISGNFAFADCPSADLNGDCFVDFEDFTLMAAQWPNGYDWNDVNIFATQWLTGYPNIPDDMVYIPGGEFEMGDHFAEGGSDELPIHTVLLDSFFMGKFEITNQQYCDYLNSAGDACDIKVNNSGIVYASLDASNRYPYCDTHSYRTYSQIDYNDVRRTFSVRTKGGRDMSNDPMVMVSWYGAAAYCNWRSQQEKYETCYNLSTWDCNFTNNGYRLPTEAEWEYAARGGEKRPYYRFPWGYTISHSHSNYFGRRYYHYDVSPTIGYHPTWYDGIDPYTAPVGSFQANGYGLYDMSGNVWERCNDWYNRSYYGVSPYDNPTGPVSGTYRVVRGGSWIDDANVCRVAYRGGGILDYRAKVTGFRVVLSH